MLNSLLHVHMSYVVGLLVRGVTRLDNIVYVVSCISSIIAMYTADTLSPLGGGIHVEEMGFPRDIVACRRDRQLYVADKDHGIWRVSTDDHSYINWLPRESALTAMFKANKLSLTSRGILVTSHKPPALFEYNTVDAQMLRDVQLPQSVKSLYHGVETSRDTFLICHQGTSEDTQQYAVRKLFLFLCV